MPSPIETSSLERAFLVHVLRLAIHPAAVAAVVAIDAGRAVAMAVPAVARRSSAIAAVAGRAVAAIVMRVLRMMSGRVRARRWGDARGLGGVRGFHRGASGFRNGVGRHGERRGLPLLLELLRHVARDVDGVFARDRAWRFAGAAALGRRSGRGQLRSPRGRRSGSRRSARARAGCARGSIPPLPSSRIARGSDGGSRGPLLLVRRGRGVRRSLGRSVRLRSGGFGRRRLGGRRDSRAIPDFASSASSSCGSAAAFRVVRRARGFTAASSAVDAVAICFHGGLRFGARLGRRAAALWGMRFRRRGLRRAATGLRAGS